MDSISKRCGSLLLIVSIGAALHAAPLVNQRYRVEAFRNPIRLKVTRLDQPGVSAEIRPRLEIFYSEADPGLAYAGLRKVEVTSTAAWRAGGSNQLEPDLYRALKPTQADAREVRELPGRIEVLTGESGIVIVTLPVGAGGAGD